MREYDYSSDGVYFITICTQNREPILSEIAVEDDDNTRGTVGDGSPVPHLKPIGYIVQEYLNRLHEKYPMVYLDCFMIMPDHVHILLSINGNNENKNETRGRAPTSLGNIIGWFKYQTTKEINAVLGTQGARIWQRSYYDHVIRGDADYWNIRQYIEENPARWMENGRSTPREGKS